MRKRSMARLVPTACSAALCVACAAPPTNFARAQQIAQDFNVDSRFGRGEQVSDHIAPAARDEYAAGHRRWGSEVHLADIEIAGMKPKGERDLIVFVRVAWYMTRDQELHSTTLEQTWRDQAGGWQLVAEQRHEGDIGLLGERIVYEAPATPHQAAQFPTIRLGHRDEPSTRMGRNDTATAA